MATVNATKRIDDGLQCGELSELLAPGPWNNNYNSTSGCHTGFGCGYGKSQVIDANGRAIAGIAAIEPNHGPMHENGTLSAKTLDAVCAHAQIMAAAWSMEKALSDILTLAQRDGDSVDLGAVERHCKAALDEAHWISD